MRRMVEKILRCYGQEIRIPRLEREVYGFLQTVRGKGRNVVLKEAGPLGMAPKGTYVFIGPAEPELQQEDLLEVGGKRFVLRQVEQVWGTSGPAYQWGMCVERGVDRWGSNG